LSYQINCLVLSNIDGQELQYNHVPWDWEATWREYPI